MPGKKSTVMKNQSTAWKESVRFQDKNYHWKINITMKNLFLYMAFVEKAFKGNPPKLLELGYFINPLFFFVSYFPSHLSKKNKEGKLVKSDYKLNTQCSNNVSIAILHSTKSKLKFGADSKPARGVSKIWDYENTSIITASADSKTLRLSAVNHSIKNLSSSLPSS